MTAFGLMLPAVFAKWLALHALWQSKRWSHLAAADIDQDWFDIGLIADDEQFFRLPKRHYLAAALLSGCHDYQNLPHRYLYRAKRRRQSNIFLSLLTEPCPD